MIKLIACDLDGTLFDDNKNIDKNIKNVIDKLKKNDILFTMVSGRNEELMDNVVDYLNIDIPYVCNNGAAIYKNHKPLLYDCIEKESVAKATRLLYENNIPFIAYGIEDMYRNLTSEFFKQRTKAFNKSFKDYYPDLDLSSDDILKITSDFINHPELIDRISMEINSYSCTAIIKAEDNIYCVNSITANKGEGLRRVCEYMGIDMSKEVMAIGDNENDLPMLKEVKVSVSMGNSDDNVKKQTDYVCLDNNHNGVSNFLSKYFKDLIAV